jgi:UDP-N-acetylmuramate dehydrogenase
MKKLVDFPVLSREPVLNADLATLTTFEVGGRADILVEPSTEEELVLLLNYLEQDKTPYFILGSGSNLLIRDGGMRGVVIHLSQLQQVERIEVVREDEKEFWLKVPSACLKAHVLQWALEKGLSGLEFSAGIPGSMGGAIFMNAGTRWGQYASITERVYLWHPQKGRIEMSPADLGMKYRGHDSTLFEEGAVVLSVLLKLQKNLCSEKSRALVSFILSYRGARQPLDWPNCGSVFKNPENTRLGAGRMIEASGLKGMRVGGAQVSDKHANFILNKGEATAKDIEELILNIQDKVEKDHGVRLEPEVVCVGEKVYTKSDAFQIA